MPPMVFNNSVSSGSKKISLTVLLPYVGEDYWFFKNFDMGPLGHICADLREHGIPFDIINPNEGAKASVKGCLGPLISLTRRLSGKQDILKNYLEKPGRSELGKIFASLLCQKPFLSPSSHILYFQPHYKNNVYTYLAILNEIKKQHKDIELICCGAFFADKTSSFLEQHRYIDVILGPYCRHEVRLIMQGARKDGVTNITFCRNGKAIMNLSGDPSGTMRTFPDYSLLVNKVGIVCIEFVKGCPFDCFFCDHRVDNLYFSIKNISILAKEIAHNYERGARGFWFQGSAINLDEDRLRSFCRMVIKGKRVLPWSAPIIPFAMKRSTFHLMAQAGCVHLRWGVESADPGMFSRFNKGLTPKSIVNGLRDAREAGINNSLTFMVGLPGEKSEDQRRKMDFIIKNRDFIQSAKVYIFEVRRNAPISLRPGDFGLRLRPDQLDERFLRYDVKGGPSWESVQVRNRLLLEEFVSFLQHQHILYQIPEEYFYSLVGANG